MYTIQKFQRSWLFLAALAMVFGLVGVREALAFVEYGAAVPSGTWGNSSTWTPSGIPGINDFVYIGSTYPTGALPAATVTLDGNQSAANLYLAASFLGTSGNSTLNLAGYTLTCPCHDWRFDVRTGRFLDAPELAIAVYPTKSEAGKLFVNLG